MVALTFGAACLLAALPAARFFAFDSLPSDILASLPPIDFNA
jgi:hypothetical protein